MVWYELLKVVIELFGTPGLLVALLIIVIRLTDTVNAHKKSTKASLVSLKDTQERAIRDLEKLQRESIKRLEKSQQQSTKAWMEEMKELKGRIIFLDTFDAERRRLEDLIKSVGDRVKGLEELRNSKRK